MPGRRPFFFFPGPERHLSTFRPSELRERKRCPANVQYKVTRARCLVVLAAAKLFFFFKKVLYNTANHASTLFGYTHIHLNSYILQ